MTDYWFEAVEISLNDEGISATKTQIENIAGAMEVNAENHGMSRGYDAIPNPANAETENLKRIHADEIKHLKKQILTYRQSVAKRRNVSPDDVYTEDGNVFYA